MAQAAQGALLDLPNPLSGDSELVADLVESERFLSIQAEVTDDDILIAAVEIDEDFVYLLSGRFSDDEAVRLPLRGVGDRVQKISAVVVFEGGVEGANGAGA